MPRYKVVITHSVQKFLKKSPDKLSKKLESIMLSLEANPRPFGYIKLKGREAYRVSIGNYRIIYEIEDKILRITVIDVGDRKGIY